MIGKEKLDSFVTKDNLLLTPEWIDLYIETIEQMDGAAHEWVILVAINQREILDKLFVC